MKINGETMNIRKIDFIVEDDWDFILGEEGSLILLDEKDE